MVGASNGRWYFALLEVYMAAPQQKNMGCVFITTRLGATQTFQILADQNVNTPDTKAKYSCGSNIGTPIAVFQTVVTKLQLAVQNGDSRVPLLVNDQDEIVG